MKSLRLISLYAVTLILTLLGGTTAGFAQGRQQRVSDPTALVDVFIGTGGHGHTHPAACVPHGMIQPGPDTRRMGWDACSGYHYADSLINGFAHQRLSGTGCADYGDFLVMPITGAPTLADTPTAGQGHDATPWASSFSHDRE
ncbi:MAG: glycoside hydrolase family 92 protein, partial [Alloprevotella sp.]|nr:glycoside hydrolase family 92 protein [Alloprevotella sp.]